MSQEHISNPMFFTPHKISAHEIESLQLAVLSIEQALARLSGVRELMHCINLGTNLGIYNVALYNLYATSSMIEQYIQAQAPLRVVPPSELEKLSSGVRNA